MIYEFTLAAGGTKILPGGYSITILESTQLVTIERLGANGGRLEISESVPASWFWHQAIWTQDPQTKSVKVTAGALGVTIKISISEGNSGVNTISGVVSVTNADKARTEAGQAFLRGEGLNPGAAKYGAIYLANPIASGVNLVLNLLNISKPAGSATGTTIWVSEDYVSLEAESIFGQSGSYAGTNKLIGGAVGKGLLRTAASNATSYSNLSAVANPIIQTEAFNKLSFTEPFVIREGMAFGIFSNAAAEIIKGVFEWFEEAA